jgi:diaminopimelate decarboxylase
LRNIQTPFYYYDTELLRKTLELVKNQTQQYGYVAHYAVKANANPAILKIIASYGLGADCVSGGEVQAAIDADLIPPTLCLQALEKQIKKLTWH